MSISPISQSSELTTLKDFVEEIKTEQLSIDVVYGTNQSLIIDQRSIALNIKGYAKDTFEGLSKANHKFAMVSALENKDLKVIYNNGDKISKLAENFLKEVLSRSGPELQTQEEFNKIVVDLIKNSVPAENLIKNLKV